MRRSFGTALLVCGSLLSSPAVAEEPADKSVGTDFVEVRGEHFYVGEKAFSFLGANLAVIQGERERERFADTLAAAAADGLTVGRVWAFGEGPADANDWLRRNQLFSAGPEGYVEESYVHLDRVLAEAHARGLRLILTLSNHWSDYGGVPQYLRWLGLPAEDAPGLEAQAAFYSDEKMRALFRKHLDRLVDRVNTITGVRYADDPTIFAWELMNESSAVLPETAAARLDWIDEMSWYIRARDRHHLVAAGVWGYGSRSERAEWIRIHQLPDIGYCDSHLYAQTTERVATVDRLLDVLDDRAQLARFVIGKPLVLGEFGFRTDRKRFLGDLRAAWFQRLLERLYRDGGAGALVWIYQAWPGKPRDFGVYIDRHATDDVRAVLRAFAAKIERGLGAPDNPRLASEVGERLLYDPLVTLRRHQQPHRHWREAGGEWQLDIAPGAFVEAHFERAGLFEGGPLTHFYGGGYGHIDYAFAAPNFDAAAKRRRPRSIHIALRSSSEWPGSSAPADGGSKVEVEIDGANVGTFAAIPDNGLGTIQEVVIEDRALVRRLSRGVHRLRFAVADTAAAHGLCIYGGPPPGALPATLDFTPIRVLYDCRKPAL